MWVVILRTFSVIGTPSTVAATTTQLETTSPALATSTSGRWYASLKKNLIKSSLYSRYYAATCNEWRAYLRGLSPGQHSSEETSQRWQAVGDKVFDLTGPGVDPQTYRIDSVCCLTNELSGQAEYH